MDLTSVTLERVDGVPPDDGFVLGSSVVEGPVWARGALYVSHFAFGEVPRSRIYRIDPDGEVTIAASDAGTNGLALGPDGRLYGARHSDGTVGVFDWDDLTAEPEPVASTYRDARFSSPNDLAIHSNGTVYFTDPAWQSPSPEPQDARRAYHVAPDGDVQVIPGTPDRPNGILLTLDERTLLITGTDGMRRYDLDEDGGIASEAANVAAITGGRDGLGQDCAGHIYVTGGDGVVVLDDSLDAVGTLSLSSELAAVADTTNAAFGGDDGRTLYVTLLGEQPGVVSARLDVPGLPY